MIEMRQTATYAKWFARLKDIRAKARVDIRIRRLSLGNPGDVKPVGKGVSELRIDVGKGYRVYFVQRGEQLILLLVGGDKSTQQHDIEKAIKMASEL
jgi:putative addiction module killer protein